MHPAAGAAGADIAAPRFWRPTDGDLISAVDLSAIDPIRWQRTLWPMIDYLAPSTRAECMPVVRQHCPLEYVLETAAAERKLWPPAPGAEFCGQPIPDNLVEFYDGADEFALRDMAEGLAIPADVIGEWGIMTAPPAAVDTFRAILLAVDMASDLATERADAQGDRWLALRDALRAWHSRVGERIGNTRRTNRPTRAQHEAPNPRQQPVATIPESWVEFRFKLRLMEIEEVAMAMQRQVASYDDDSEGGLGGPPAHGPPAGGGGPDDGGGGLEAASPVDSAPAAAAALDALPAVPWRYDSDDDSERGGDDDFNDNCEVHPSEDAEMMGYDTWDDDYAGS